MRIWARCRYARNITIIEDRVSILKYKPGLQYKPDRRTDASCRRSVCLLSVPCRLSVCNVVAPYSDGLTFRQYFCTLFIAWGVGTRSLCILNFDKKKRSGTWWCKLNEIGYEKLAFFYQSRFISRTVQDTVQLIKDEWEIVCDLYGAISNDLQWPLTYNFKVTILINVK